jgi:hypothetical protein
MRSAQFWTILALTASAGAVSPLALAQQPPQQPPQLQRLDEGEPPASNIPGGMPEERVITETRQQGQVKEVQVSKGKNTYYLKPNTPAGSSVPGDSQSSINRGAQWQVMQFNSSQSESKKNEDLAKAREIRNTPALPPPKATTP